MAKVAGVPESYTTPVKRPGKRMRWRPVRTSDTCGGADGATGTSGAGEGGTSGGGAGVDSSSNSETEEVEAGIIRGAPAKAMPQLYF